jgi:uncharacterized protein (DUF58 family)
MAERVRRWHGATGAIIAFVAMGIATTEPALFVAALVPLFALVAATVGTVDVTPEDVTVTRSIHPSPVAPGRTVAVELVVTNRSERTFPDVRVVDGVPEQLSVTRGTPRGAAVLDPGDALTLRYTVTARRGEFTFAPPAVRLRNVAGTAHATLSPAPTGDAHLTCRLDAGDVPLDEDTSRQPGPLTSTQPGSGVEFHTVREYEPGDPVSRIDWNHLAKRGEVATIDYRESHAATTILVIDAREQAHAAAAPGQPSAPELGAYAATHAFDVLRDASHEVGVGILGVTDTRTDAPFWVPPSTAAATRVAVRDALGIAAATDPGLAAISASERTDGEDHLATLLDRAPAHAQLLFLTPLLDDAPVDAVCRAAARGHDVAVFSPDVIAANTVGGTVAALERRLRLARCQTATERVVDWRRQTPLAVALQYAIATEGTA